MSLINALLPLIRTLQITSLSPFSVSSSLNYFRSNRSSLWNILSILLVVVLFIHGILDFNFYSDRQPSTTKTIIFIKLCTVRLCHIAVLIDSFVQRKDLIEIIDTLSLIDSTFTKKLGLNVGHNHLKNLLLNCLIFGSAAFVLIISSVLAIFLNYSPIKFFIFWIANSLSLSVICLRYVQILTFIYIIQSRLTIINCNLNKIDAEILIGDTRTKHVSIIGHLEEDNRDILKIQKKKLKNFDEIPILRELYGKLWDASKLINTCFGTSLLVCIGNDFGTVTLNGYWMYLNFAKSDGAAITYSIGLWSIPHLVCLILIAGSCYLTVFKVSEKRGRLSK